MTTEAPPADKPFKDIIPAELHDRGWAKPFLDKPYNTELTLELVKKLDGAESLIGRKIGIPTADAKPEEVAKFYETLRPAKPEEYEFKLGEKADEATYKEMRAAAHAAGLDKRQMAKFVEAMTPGFEARRKAAEAEAAKRDQEFDALVEQTFGKDPAVSAKAIDDARAALKEHAPAAVQALIPELDNKALAVLAGAVKSILAKYTPEDDLNKNKEGAGSNGTDAAALRKEARDLMAKPEYRDFRHADHEKTKARIAEIYAHPALKGSKA